MQTLGKSTVAEIGERELLDKLSKGGDFESLQNSAFITLIYHRWDECYRCRIAAVLGLESKTLVECTLMDDLEAVRDMIVRKGSAPSPKPRLLFLSQIWGDTTIVTDLMVHLLMEQINSIHIRIATCGSVPILIGNTQEFAVRSRGSGERSLPLNRGLLGSLCAYLRERRLRAAPA